MCLLFSLMACLLHQALREAAQAVKDALSKCSSAPKRLKKTSGELVNFSDASKPMHGLMRSSRCDADLLEEAAQAVKDALNECSSAPERLKKTLALSWSLATASARRAWAEAETAEGQAGSAVAGIDVRPLLGVVVLMSINI